MPRSKVNDLKKQLEAAEKEREENLRASRNKANVKYAKKTYTVFRVNLRNDTQKDIIDFVSNKGNINQYLQELIKKDMHNTH